MAFKSGDLNERDKKKTVQAEVCFGPQSKVRSARYMFSNPLSRLGICRMEDATELRPALMMYQN